MRLISAADLDVTNLETNDVQVLTRDNGFGKPERDMLLAPIAGPSLSTSEEFTCIIAGRLMNVTVERGIGAPTALSPGGMRQNPSECGWV
jgi:hypothetical protein